MIFQRNRADQKLAVSGQLKKRRLKTGAQPKKGCPTKSMTYKQCEN
jgi:hypothetical protein